MTHDYPAPLRHVDMLDVLRRAQSGDANARDIAVLRNMKLVLTTAHRIVRSMQRPDLLDDLVQAGVVGYRGKGGLLRAIELFDPDRGTRFSTYAMPWIRDAMLQLSNDNIVVATARPGTRIVIQRVAERLRRELGRDPTPDEIRADYAARSRRPPSRAVCSHVQAPLTFEPLDEGLAVNGDELWLTRDQLVKLLSRLDDRERTVIEMRYGLVDGEPQELAAIGKVLGLSRQYVQQIELTALARLRRFARRGGA